MASSTLVLSHFQAALMLKAIQAEKSIVETSTDLGITSVVVQLHPEGAVFPDGTHLSLESLEEILANKTACYAVIDHSPEIIRAYSDLSGRYFSLMPTESAPTMLISGIPMHRIKGVNPHQDTLSKIKALAPIRGRVLDTATGLGYTAIEAAKTAVQVVTIEIDPVAQQIARLNPWSQALFDHPRITQVIGDSFDEIMRFEAESFSCIMHDPPTISLAGELYSGAFYREAFRVLKQNGRMFHYIGDPERKSGLSITKGVIRRLQEAGFFQVIKKPQAFGVVAQK